MGKVMEKPQSVFSMVDDLRAMPKVAVDPEEQEIRSKELAEETALEAALNIACAARLEAEGDLAALEKKSKDAGGTSYLSVMGIETKKPANEEIQRACRSFGPLAEQLVSDAKEAERQAQVLLNSAQTAHRNRKTRLLMLQEREREKAVTAEKARRLKEQRAARIAEMKAFLKA